jgi:hypothetical protein
MRGENAALPTYAPHGALAQNGALVPAAVKVLSLSVEACAFG